MFPAATTERTARAPVFIAAASVLFLMLSVLAGEPPVLAPLPPPPELLLEALDALPELPADPEEVRRALEPPAAIVPPAPLPAVSSAEAALTAPLPTTAPLSDMTISLPSRYGPDDYFHLPLEDQTVPGVVLPEIDRAHYARMTETAGRPALPGLSIRQLEPYFALAKGTEAMAIETGKTGEGLAYREQLSKAMDAYLAIISMADASSEAREEAWYGVARCEYRLGNWWRAFDALERSFPRKFEKSEVAGRLKLEMFIGERLWRMAGEPVPDANPDGIPLTGYQAASLVYAAIVFNQPISEDAPLAILRRGDAAALDNDWTEAAKFYRQVIEYYPESEQAMQARSSLAESVYRQEWPAGFPEAARDDLGRVMDDVERAGGSLSDDARERRQRAVSIANDLEAEIRLRQAKEYLKSIRVRKSRDAAVFLLGDIVSFYPATAQAVEAADMLRDLGIEPPLVLSDGSRFPITGGASGADSPFAAAVIGVGSVELEDRLDADDGIWPLSPTRETVYE